AWLLCDRGSGASLSPGPTLPDSLESTWPSPFPFVSPMQAVVVGSSVCLRSASTPTNFAQCIDLPPRGGRIRHQGHGRAGLAQIHAMPRRRRFAADAVPVRVGSAVLVPVVRRRRLAIEIPRPAATAGGGGGIAVCGPRHSLLPGYVSLPAVQCPLRSGIPPTRRRGPEELLMGRRRGPSPPAPWWGGYPKDAAGGRLCLPRP